MHHTLSVTNVKTAALQTLNFSMNDQMAQNLKSIKALKMLGTKKHSFQQLVVAQIQSSEARIKEITQFLTRVQQYQIFFNHDPKNATASKVGTQTEANITAGRAQDLAVDMLCFPAQGKWSCLKVRYLGGKDRAWHCVARKPKKSEQTKPPAHMRRTNNYNLATNRLSETITKILQPMVQKNDVDIAL